MIPKPEYHEHEEYQNRLSKLQKLKDLGVDPYPNEFNPSHSAEAIHAQYANDPVGDSAAAEAGSSPRVKVAGRLILFRGMGKNAFGTLLDGNAQIQVMFNRELSVVTGYDHESCTVPQAPKPLKLIEKQFDLGDILGVEGELFRTMKGELTVFVKEVTLLCKTLLPLADKHAGLADKELRYRKRWLDLISNQQVRETFIMRSKITKMIRNSLEEQGFMEVETPVLQSIYGGAEARPFTTELNALKQEMFMRISLEISLKKLIVGGMNKIFEIGKVFRNEGCDRTHNPEFSMLEAYAAYWDYNDMMKMVENLFEKIALETHGSTIVPVNLDGGDTVIEVDMKAPWRRLTMKESIATYADIDVDQLSDECLQEILINEAKEDPLVIKKLSRGLLIAKLFEAKVESHLIQPHHITDHPVETTPLCKPHRDPDLRSDGIVERFESFILGNEICNAYTELNDPEIQRTLLEQQALKLHGGDEEAAPMDEEFLEAICQGMPPTGGVGIGIDRMVMLFTNSPSIRDVLYFPWMRPGALLAETEASED